MRRAVLSIVVICSASLGTAAQAPPRAVSGDEHNRFAGLQLQLGELGKQLLQDAKDVSEMSRPFVRDCELRDAIAEISEQASDASSVMSSAFDMLEIYSTISTAKDRIAAGKVLSKHMAEAKRSLDSPIKLINLELSTPSLPNGAAVTGTRIKDNIRSAMDVFDKIKPE